MPCFPLGEARVIATYQMDKRYYHSRGHAVWIQLNVSLVRDEQGEPLYFVAHIQDITGRKATEAQLRDSEERFRRLASTAPIGIFQTDAVGRCTYANQTWATICGVTGGVFPGREWTAVVHSDDIGGARESWGNAIEGLVPFEHRFRADVGSDEARWVDVRLVPLPRENGRPPEWVGTATDVTLLLQANGAIDVPQDDPVAGSLTRRKPFG
jgi:PAS domain S-box-containing protein